MTTKSIDFFKKVPYRLSNGVNAPVLVVCPLQTPENYGNIIRLADTIGCPVLYLLKSNFPVSERKIRKTAGDSFHRIKIIYLTEEELEDQLPLGFTLVGLETASGSQNIFQTTLPQSMALVVGNEKNGIQSALLEKCSLTVHIPLTGECTSLNVTHALAVALFEWLRNNLK
jgi:tRNA G18 (ribose-2'-O)-methylase SpoU